MATVYFHARKRNYDSNYSISHQKIHNEKIILNRHEHICSRDINLSLCPKLLCFNGWSNPSRFWCWDYDAAVANDYVLNLPDSSKRESDGDVWPCHRICTCDWAKFIRLACWPVPVA